MKHAYIFSNLFFCSFLTCSVYRFAFSKIDNFFIYSYFLCLRLSQNLRKFSRKLVEWNWRWRSSNANFPVICESVDNLHWPHFFPPTPSSVSSLSPAGPATPQKVFSILMRSFSRQTLLFYLHLIGLFTKNYELPPSLKNLRKI